MWAFGGPLTGIGFDEVPVPTVVRDQFQGQGMTFTDGDEQTLADPSFEEDGVGLAGAGGIRIHLSQPARAVGAFFPGGMSIDVFESQGGPLLHQSADFGGGGTGFFGGVVGGADFGFVEIRDWVDDNVFIDDLFIGFSLPEGTISGCIEVTGIPLTLNVVGLLQPGEAPQFTLTDGGAATPSRIRCPTSGSASSSSAPECRPRNSAPRGV